MTYAKDERDAAAELLSACDKLPNKRIAARIKQAGRDLAIAIQMGQSPERVAELDRVFMRSFNG